MPFELRKYQSECVEAIEQHYAQGGQAALISVATGLGKTVILSELVHRTLVIVADNGTRPHPPPCLTAIDQKRRGRKRIPVHLVCANP